MSHATDNIQSIAGFSYDVTKSYDQIHTEIKKLLIENAMTGGKNLSFLESPYVSLGLTLGLPLFARYQQNKALIKKGINPSEMVPKPQVEKKKHNDAGIRTDDSITESTIKVEYNV